MSRRVLSFGHLSMVSALAAAASDRSQDVVEAPRPASPPVPQLPQFPKSAIERIGESQRRVAALVAGHVEPTEDEKRRARNKRKKMSKRATRS